MNQRLRSILSPYDNWLNNEGEEKNRAAKEALIRFYMEFKKEAPSKEYFSGSMFHTSYLRDMLAIKRALVEEKYMRACNEIISLMTYRPFLQRRIYYNLLKVLEGELLKAGGNA